MFRRSLFMLQTYAQHTGRPGGVLFTAGPINTSETVRKAQLVDYGSRDKTFVDAVKDVRTRLLNVGGVDATNWSAIPLQGSGTMGVEACLSSILPPVSKDGNNDGKKCLVLRNGAYSSRMGAIVEKLGVPLVTVDAEEGQDFDIIALQKVLSEEKDNIACVGVVHCETSTGMFNSIHGVHRLIRRFCPDATILIDAMSSFGAVDFNVEDVCDVLVSSANKCIQGTPGFSVILARKAVLNASRGRSPSTTLDIVAQCDGLDKSGQFNYTPPVQTIMAFHEALKEHEAEGGNVSRGERYATIAHYIADEMTALGFELFLDRSKPSFGYIITAYRSPRHPQWDFNTFYNKLNEAGFVIYPGKASKADTFRIGSLGDITLDDAKALIAQVKVVLADMGVDLTVK